MKTRYLFLLAVLLLWHCGDPPEARTEDFYYDLDSIYYLSISPRQIVVQLDTTNQFATLEALLANHSCVTGTVASAQLPRGFTVMALDTFCTYQTILADLEADTLVNRALPAYLSAPGSAEMYITDLVSIQFAPDMSVDSMSTLLTAHGLRFVDSSQFAPGLWRCALNDSVRSGTLDRANEMHLLPQTRWACASFFAEVRRDGPDIDPYYKFQYYLKNIGDSGGVADVDIDADLAWLVPLKDSSFAIAVLDDGVIAHEDLPQSRMTYGYDFGDDDYYSNPPLYESHGLACAGIIGAGHNSVGIRGVFGSCTIVPVKIYGDDEWGYWVDDILDPSVAAKAIRYAAQHARVLSCSWSYPRRYQPFPEVANAIRDVVNGCDTLGPLSGRGVVVCFAAGNEADNGWPDIEFPANMPEVITVGAVNRAGQKWDYSNVGPELDVLAPSGNDGDEEGDQTPPYFWSLDQTGNLGRNPYITGGYVGETNDYDYTRVFGGTSAACPQVAAIAGLILARGHPGIDATCRPMDDVYEIITRSAIDMGASGWDDSTGFGRVNAYRALLSIIHGDVNNDGTIDALDLGAMIDVLFAGKHAALDDATVDFDCDGFGTVLDLGKLIDHVFAGGAAPPICFDYH